MKLTELKPRWLDRNVKGEPCGVSFLCPHCRTQRLGVFWDAQAFHDWDGDGVVDEGEIVIVADKVWVKTGADFESLTITPSIDTSASGHWHGHITNGEIT